MLYSYLTKPSSLILKGCFKVGVAFSTPESVRCGHKANKHFLPKWRKFRALKTIKIELPNYHKDEKPLQEMTEEEQRSWYKEMGVQPMRPWSDKPFSVLSTSGVFDQYLPPEGDGKLSALNSAGARQKMEWLKKKTKSMKDLREIRKYEDEFDLYPEFVEKAQEIYLKAHEALAANDTDKLITYVTEKAYPIMLYNSEQKTIRWNFIKSLEPPRVCHVRIHDFLNKFTKFAQITVRFHSQQTLAIYDRFGRLMYGSESVGKDVLEYVVFEKMVTSLHGEWRMHHKIIPDWCPEGGVAPRTYILDENAEEEEQSTPDEPDVVLKIPS